jgi:hypothetical protein
LIDLELADQSFELRVLLLRLGSCLGLLSDLAILRNKVSLLRKEITVLNLQCLVLFLDLAELLGERRKLLVDLDTAVLDVFELDRELTDLLK